RRHVARVASRGRERTVRPHDRGYASGQERLQSDWRHGRRIHQDDSARRGEPVQMTSGPVTNQDRISVCICTLKRRDWLTALLGAVASQVVDERFTFDVVVVDNDLERSSEYVVRRAARGSHIQFTYDCEPERNISLARNRAIRNAT